jgi:hypothetical protein
VAPEASRYYPGTTHDDQYWRYNTMGWKDLYAALPHRDGISRMAENVGGLVHVPGADSGCAEGDKCCPEA